MMRKERTTEINDRQVEVLRRDVSFLGALLGEVLREQGGNALFDTV